MLFHRYATASARSDGMLLLCGGRDSSGMVQTALFFSFVIIYAFMVPSTDQHSLQITQVCQLTKRCLLNSSLV